MSEERTETEDSKQEVAKVETPVPVVNGLDQARVATEDRAKRLGWVPEEQFKGDSRNYVDAETFINRMESSASILIERNRALDNKLVQQNEKIENQSKEITAMRQQLSTLTDTLGEFRDFASTSSKRAYQKARTDLEREMEQAVSEADLPKFKAAMEGLKDLNKEAEEEGATRSTAQKVATQVEEKKSEVKAEPENTEKPQPTVHPDILDFLLGNPWFTQDSVRNSYMQDMHMELLRTKPTLTLSQNLEEAKKLVIAKFPERFGINPKREEPSALTEGDTKRPGRPKKLGYSDLPPEAKAACDKLVKNMQTKDKNTGQMIPYTREEYCRVYYGEEE